MLPPVPTDSDWFPVRILTSFLDSIGQTAYTFGEVWATPAVADRIGGRINTTQDPAYAIDGATFSPTAAGSPVQVLARRAVGMGGVGWELKGFGGGGDPRLLYDLDASAGALQMQPVGTGSGAVNPVPVSGQVFFSYSIIAQAFSSTGTDIPLLLALGLWDGNIPLVPGDFPHGSHLPDPFFCVSGINWTVERVTSQGNKPVYTLSKCGALNITARGFGMSAPVIWPVWGAGGWVNLPDFDIQLDLIEFLVMPIKEGAFG